MTIEITYCRMWNYEPYAARVAAELQEGLGVRAKLIQGSGGVFDVTVDGQRVYSKHRTGRFPHEREVLAAVQALQ